MKILKHESVSQGGGVITVEDFLSSSEITEALEYRKGFEEISVFQNHTHRKKLNVQGEYKSRIQMKLSVLMASEEFRDAIAPWTDHAWRLIYNASPGTFELGISRYQAGGAGYRWHCDHADGFRRISNVIMTLNQVEGGELEWTTAPMTNEQLELECPEEKWFQGPAEGVALPIPGQLIVMPSHYPHRVCPSPEMRISMHGHQQV